MLFLGGFDGQSFVSTVEIYDPSKDQWEMGEPMTSGRSGHCCAVLYHHCYNFCLKKGPNS